jgi:hypothetical protein
MHAGAPPRAVLARLLGFAVYLYAAALLFTAIEAISLGRGADILGLVPGGLAVQYFAFVLVVILSLLRSSVDRIIDRLLRTDELAPVQPPGGDSGPARPN